MNSMTTFLLSVSILTSTVFAHEEPVIETTEPSSKIRNIIATESTLSKVKKALESDPGLVEPIIESYELVSGDVSSNKSCEQQVNFFLEADLWGDYSRYMGNAYSSANSNKMFNDREYEFKNARKAMISYVEETLKEGTEYPYYSQLYIEKFSTTDGSDIYEKGYVLCFSGKYAKLVKISILVGN